MSSPTQEETKEIREFHDLPSSPNPSMPYGNPAHGDLARVQVSPSQSPVQEIRPATIPLDFPDALREVLAGGKMARRSWEDPDIYITLSGGFLSIYTTSPNPRTEADGTVKGPGIYPYLIDENDLLANDWVAWL